MRKLTKKISMLMVLAMLVGLFSGVVSASAASKWSFKSGKYDVAVGGEINMKKSENGKQGEYADFDLLKEGKAPEGYTVTWESSNEDVVWVNAKTGQLRADKAKVAKDGDKAVITANIVNDTNKKTHAVSFTIVVGEVKAPVYTLQAPKFEEAVEVGTELKFSTNVLDEEGNTVSFKECGLYRAYFLNGEAVATTWTAEKAGEYTFTVGAFKAKADMADLANAVDKAEFTVVVAPDNTFAIKQASMTSFTMTFGEGKDLSKVTKADVAVAEAASIDGAKVTLPIKEVTVKDNVITVGLYQELAKDSYIFGKYLDGAYEGFKVAKGDVAKVVVSAKEVLINDFVALDIKLYDANEIDITTPEGLARVTVEATAGKDNCAISDKSILFWEAGKNAVVVATYHTYDYLTNNDGTEVTYKSAAAEIKAVKEEVSLSAVEGWALMNAGDDKTKLTYTATVSLAANDTNKKVVGKLTKTTVTTQSKTDSVYTADLDGYTFASGDTTKLLVIADGTLIPVAEGTVDVLLKDGEGKIKGVVSVIVMPKREASTISLKPSKTTMSTVGGDKIEATLEVKDQYTDKCAVAAGDITIKNVASGAEVEIDGVKISYADGKLIFAGYAAGNYSYSVTVNKKVAYISFKVQAPEAAATYKLNASATTLSTKITADGTKTLAEAYKDITVSIAAYDKYGFLTATPGTDEITAKIDNAATVAANGAVTGGKFYVVLTGPEGNTSIAVDNGDVVLDALAVSGSAITKAKAGEYTITLYKSSQVGNTNNVSFAFCDSIKITVTDGQPGFTAKLVKNTSELAVGAVATNLDTIIGACYEIKDANGTVKTLTGYRDLDKLEADKVVVFKSVKYDESFAFADGSYTVEQSINLLTSPITFQ